MTVKRTKKRTRNTPVAVVTEPKEVEVKGPQFSFKDKVQAIEVLETSKSPKGTGSRGDNDAREGRLLDILRRPEVTEIWVTRIAKKSVLARSIGRQLDATGRATVEIKVEVKGEQIVLANYHWDLDQFRCSRCRGIHGAGKLGTAQEVTDCKVNSDLRRFEKLFKGYLVQWVVKGGTGPSASLQSKTCFDGSKTAEEHEATGLRNLILRDPDLKAKLVWDLPKEIS